MTSPRICIVTGASSGIGQATALALLDAGQIVCGAARRLDRMDPVRDAGGHTVATDITDEADRRRLVATVLREHGRLDALANCAGTSMPGALEDVLLADARRVFEVNLFGAAALTQLVLPAMRAQGGGTIINISSIGGEASFPLAGWYYASKHALEGWTDTLRQEVARFGVRVVLIQPGIIRTAFEQDTARLLRETSGQGAYGCLGSCRSGDGGPPSRRRLGAQTPVRRRVPGPHCADPQPAPA
jgi:NAD(P)-dependent dehydrogenase (short-subunit alcohol dehydrogenase family)